MNALTKVDLTRLEPTPEFVDWIPIASAKSRFKDGRSLLGWAGVLVVISWCDGWRDAVGRPARGVTHFADVGGPK